MEFVNGGDLYSLLQNVGYLEEDVTCLYVAEIGLALHYLHSTLGVVHRDIKPENVLIHQDGHIKLTDFGLSVFGLSDWPIEREPMAGDGEYGSLSAGPSATPSMPSSLPGSGLLGGFGTLRDDNSQTPTASTVAASEETSWGAAASCYRRGSSRLISRESSVDEELSLKGNSAAIAADSTNPSDYPVVRQASSGSVLASSAGSGTPCEGSTPLGSPSLTPSRERRRDGTSTSSPRLGTAAAPNRPPPAVPTQQSEMRATVGTPDYMAPELLLGERHGKGVDLWALGCLTFELLTGYTPFTGKTVEEVFEHILEHTNGEAIRWPEEEGHLSPHAMSLIRELLHPLPEHRLGADAIDSLCNHPFFDDNGIDWQLLQERQGAVPFVPKVQASDDTSYFVPKPQPPLAAGRHPGSSSSSLCSSKSSSDDGASPIAEKPTAGASPVLALNGTDQTHSSLTEESEPVADADYEEDPEFINFTYENIPALLQKTLEYTERASAIDTSPPPSARANDAEPSSARDRIQQEVVTISADANPTGCEDVVSESDPGRMDCLPAAPSAASSSSILLCPSGARATQSATAGESGCGSRSTNMCVHLHETDGSANGSISGCTSNNSPASMGAGIHDFASQPPTSQVGPRSSEGDAGTIFEALSGMSTIQDTGNDTQQRRISPSHAELSGNVHSPLFQRMSTSAIAASATALHSRPSNRSTRSPHSLSPRSSSPLSRVPGPLSRRTSVCSTYSASPHGSPTSQCRFPGPLSPYRSPTQRTPNSTPPNLTPPRSPNTSPRRLRASAGDVATQRMPHLPLAALATSATTGVAQGESRLGGSVTPSPHGSQRSSPRVSPRLRPHLSSPLSVTSAILVEPASQNRIAPPQLAPLPPAITNGHGTSDTSEVMTTSDLQQAGLPDPQPSQ